MGRINVHAVAGIGLDQFNLSGGQLCLMLSEILCIDAEKHLVSPIGVTMAGLPASRGTGQASLPGRDAAIHGASPLCTEGGEFFAELLQFS
ncbi:hypothetical protein D3C75_791530 [compost metagenome]